MNTRVVLTIACLGSLMPPTAKAQDEPRHASSKTSEPSSKKKHVVADNDDDEVKPKKKPAKKPVAEVDDEPAKAKKEDTEPASDGSKKKSAKDDDGDAKPAKDKDAEPTAEPKKPQAHPAAVATLTPDELSGFDQYPAELQTIIEQALALTHLNLAYTFGGSSPAEGGMDCSGTIDYVLTQHGMKDVPRSSDEICEWVRKRSGLHLAPDGVELTHDAFSALRPGDLLFWTGTYETLPRKLPVSHIMMYLGTLKKSGKPVVFGSSDGRYYDGQRRSGVSVFDFSMPRSGSKAAFFGYGSIPGMIRTKAQEEVRKALPPPGKELVAANEPDKKPTATDDAPPPPRKHTPAPADDDPPAPGPKKTKVNDEPSVVAKSDADTPKPKKKVLPVEEDSPPPKKTIKASDDKPAKTVAKADDDEPEKAPAPHKPTVHKKKSSGATAKRKADADDTTPGAVVRKAVDSVRKAFE